MMIDDAFCLYCSGGEGGICSTLFPLEMCYYCIRLEEKIGCTVSHSGRLRRKCPDHPRFYLYHAKINVREEPQKTSGLLEI